MVEYAWPEHSPKQAPTPLTLPQLGAYLGGNGSLLEHYPTLHLGPL